VESLLLKMKFIQLFHWEVFHLRDFIGNRNAVSEEFTMIPALVVVMVGFAVFALLIVNTYGAYNQSIESTENYRKAEIIVSKLTNPEGKLIDEGGVINLPDLINHNEWITSEYDTYQGVKFFVRVNWEDNQGNAVDIAKPDNFENIGDHVAVSKIVSVYLNPAETKPGTFTLILWSE
jgi:hypothetical protein